MSRSYKKHCGSSHTSCRSDKSWRKQWHSSMRAKERDLFIRQIKFPDDDYCYPIPEEIEDIYCAPSDGGSYWMYSSFEHYYHEITHPHWSYYGSLEFPKRKEAFKEWKKNLVGK